ncbi:MAG: patatin-like phospholipase family protein [Clostridia bacterium]|nr:patatin-like phospholipase family protein [Clostridia bacterium]
MLFRKKPTVVGLCLGGGGTRGFAHLGALKAFEEYGIKFDMVAGCSVGSCAGAFISAGMTFEQTYDIAKVLQVKDIRRNKIKFMPSSTEGLEELIKNNISQQNIEDLPKKLFVVTVDAKTGKEVVFENGSLAKAVAGSCAVPGVFYPVNYANMTLIDGGVMNNIPADVLRKNGCDVVITVDVNSTRGGGTSSDKFYDVLLASIGIMMKNNSNQGYLYSDIVIQPDMKRFKSSKLDGYEAMIEEGYNATVAAMPEILKLINNKRYRLWKRNKRKNTYKL